MKHNALVHYQAELWPSVCKVQGWNVKDEQLRRDIRAKCWELILREDKGDAIPGDKDETTALFTYLRHLEQPNNINRSMEWDKCRANYRAYNTAKRADWWERRGFGRKGSRKLRENRFAGRDTAVGSPLDDPLSQDEADQRLWKMRQKTRERERDGIPRRPATRKPAPQQATGIVRTIPPPKHLRNPEGIPAANIPF